MIRNPTIAQIQSKVAFLNRVLPGHEIVAAGGVLRDIILGKPIKDIDFFISGGPSDHFEKAWEPLKREFACGHHTRDRAYVGCENLSGSGGFSSGYGGRHEDAPALMTVSDDSYSAFWVAEYFDGWYGYPTQLVYVFDGEVRTEVFEKFDFALSRVWADATRLRWSPEFASDRDNKRLTLFDSGWGKTAADRVARLREKFSDYRFVNRSSTPFHEPCKHTFPEVNQDRCANCGLTGFQIRSKA
jgi:hypothetical protein